MKKRDDNIAYLFDLNMATAKREVEGGKALGPGLPPCVGNPQDFITEDTALTWEGW